MVSIHSALVSADFQFARWSYQLGETISDTDSRIYALAISPLCGICFVGKTMVEAAKLVSTTSRSIYHGRFIRENWQMIVVHACQIVRYLAGAILGTAVGLYSPKMARNVFLTRNGDLLPRCIDETKGAQLYSLFYGVQTFLNEHDIEYRMMSGTFLGAIRHGGIIPWDDDIDIMLAPDARERFEELADTGVFTRETGITIKWHNINGSWQVYYDDCEEAASILEGTKFPFVDLFATRYTGDGRIVYYSTMSEQSAPEDYYTQEEWNNSAMYPFGPLEISGPANPDDYFERVFGREAQDFAYLLYHHTNFRIRQWPQWVYVADDGPLLYDENLYLSLVEKIENYLL